MCLTVLDWLVSLVDAFSRFSFLGVFPARSGLMPYGEGEFREANLGEAD